MSSSGTKSCDRIDMGCSNPRNRVIQAADLRLNECFCAGSFAPDKCTQEAETRERSELCVCWVRAEDPLTFQPSGKKRIVLRGVNQPIFVWSG